MKKVLVADDKGYELVLCTVPLRKAGYEVVEASQPDKAVEAYLRERPDAVLSDYRFEGEKDERGLWIGSEIRRTEAERNLPRAFMVLMSKDTVPEAKWRAAGFDDFFDKIYFHSGGEKRLIKMLQGAKS